MRNYKMSRCTTHRIVARSATGLAVSLLLVASHPTAAQQYVDQGMVDDNQVYAGQVHDGQVYDGQVHDGQVTVSDGQCMADGGQGVLCDGGGGLCDGGLCDGGGICQGAGSICRRIGDRIRSCLRGPDYVWPNYCGLMAPQYPVPYDVPRWVGRSQFTYPPMMPHHSLPHYRTTYAYRHGPGMARTTVNWHPSLGDRLKRLRNVFELPR
jgi:hypothetical protein